MSEDQEIKRLAVQAMVKDQTMIIILTPTMADVVTSPGRL